MARGSVDIRPLNEVFGIPGASTWIRSSPLRIVRDDKVEENIDSVAGTGTADTSEKIKVNSSATRPARVYCMIVGPAGLKMKRVRKPDSYSIIYFTEECYAYADARPAGDNNLYKVFFR